MIEAVHRRHKLPQWQADRNQLGCLAHIVNLGNIDVMKHITRITAMETSTAIWEYDLLLADNFLLNGSLDVWTRIAIPTNGFKYIYCI